MRSEELKERTKRFGLKILRLADQLPQNKSANVITKQLMRSATSVGANYRAACRARSQADFISKIAIVEEEADESIYWLELLADTKVSDPDILRDLLKEANELTAIFAASRKTARQNS